MSDIITELNQLTEATIDDIVKSVNNTSAGYNVGLNITGINLEGPARSLFPVLAPFRNDTARVQAPVGAKAAQWKAITGINVTNQSIYTGWGSAGGQVSTSEQDYAAYYQPIALGDTVTWDAEDLARGYDQLRAGSGVRLLYALMIKEDQGLLGASNVPLNTPAAPALAAASTGGSIPASTVLTVSVAARTLVNYFDGGGTVYGASANITVANGTATNSVTAMLPGGVRGAVAFDWLVNGFYYTTTVLPILTITSVPNADLPPASLPWLGGAAASAASRAADSSANANSFNGLMTSLYADYNTAAPGQIQAGQGIPSGAYFANLNGATLTGSNGGCIELDNALQNMWDYHRIGPTAMLCSSQQGRDITRKVIASGGAYTLFQPGNVEERRAVVGGTYLETYLNPALNGQPIEVRVMPHIPPGTVTFISERLPFPDTEITNVFEVETQREYSQIEYAMSRGSGPTGGPRYDFEVRAIETFKNYYPAGCAVVSGIAAG
jgi:hypothetical protein